MSQNRKRYSYDEKIRCSVVHCGYFVPCHWQKIARKKIHLNEMKKYLIRILIYILTKQFFPLHLDKSYIVHICDNDHPICWNCFYKLNFKKICVLCRVKYDFVYVRKICKYNLRSRRSISAFYKVDGKLIKYNDIIL